MRNHLLAICLPLIFVAACAPANSGSAQQQTVDSAEVSESTHDEEDEHDNEDGDEHGSEESVHSDDDEEEHDDENGRRDLGAHEHGVAELTVAWSGNEMAIDLQTPSYNVLGFEYAPTSDEEKALVAESVAALDAGNLLQLNSDAECTLVSASVQSDLVEEAHDDEAHDDEEHGDNEAADHDEDHSDDDHSDEDHGDEDHGDEDHGDEAHSEFDVSYNLECQQSDKIESLDASALFERFPNFEDVEVQWVSDTQQSAAEITPENPVVSLN